MGRLIDRTWARVVLAIFALHLLLLPALFAGIAGIVGRNNQDTFANQVRMNARLVADELERLPAEDFTARVGPILDSAVLSGQCIFADVVVDGRVYRGSVLPEARGAPIEDFSFGEHGDSTYFVTVPVPVRDRHAILRIGFDETPTLAAIAASKRQLSGILLLYAGTSILLGGWFAWWLVRPLQDLQVAAARVRSGERELPLVTRSRLWEIRQLSLELDTMRTELLAANEQLRQEALEREQAESLRARLEIKLQEKKRLETIGTLAGGIAHEFNNILLPILLYAEEVTEALPENSPLRDDMAQVVKAAHRARRLTSDVLMFGRGPEASSAQVFQIAGVIDDVTGYLRKLAPPDVTVRTTVEPNCPQVRGDPNLLHQLLVNLCVNACQAMRDGGGDLTVSLRAESVTAHPRIPDGRYVVLGVRDQGHGVAPEILGRVFDPFFTTREVGDGSGLGLSVVHGIAAGLGATIMVDSEVGKGSLFQVYIPAIAAMAAERAAP